MHFTPNDLSRISLCRAIASLLDADGGVAKRGLQGCFEAEVSRSLEREYGQTVDALGWRIPGEYLVTRDLTAGTPSGGGYLVQTDNLVGLTIEAQRPQSIAGRFGVTVIRPTVTSTIPRITASQAAEWLPGEASQGPETDSTLGQIAVTPKVVSTTIDLSQSMVRLGGPERDAVIAADLRARVLEALNGALLNGTGNLGQPLGVLNTAGVGTVEGASMDRADVVELQHDVALSDMLSPAPGHTGYVAHPTVAQLLMNRQAFTGSDRTLWEGSMFEGNVAGAPAIATTACPTATMVLGSWNELAIAEFDGGAIELAVDPATNFRTGIVTVRAMARFDIFLRKPGAFSVATGIN